MLWRSRALALRLPSTDSVVVPPPIEIMPLPKPPDTLPRQLSVPEDVNMDDGALAAGRSFDTETTVTSPARIVLPPEVADDVPPTTSPTEAPEVELPP